MARARIRQLAQVCRRIGTALRAGVEIRTAWDQEARRGPPAQRMEMARISSRVAAGDSAAAAMRDGRGFFPPLLCELVDVGEQTGKLDESLLRLADHYDHMLQLRRSFLLGIAWPALELAGAIVVIGLLIWILGMITPASGEPVRVLGLAGNRGLLIYVTVVGAIVGAAAVPVWAVFGSRIGAAPMELAMRVPGLGRLLTATALSRLCWSLAMALDAGLDARRSIRLALRSTQNAYYISHADRVDGIVLAGAELHEALRATGAFPEEFLDALETAELAGAQSESLPRLSADYQERAAAASRVLTVIAAIAVWAVVAAIIIALIFQLFYSIYYAPIKEALDFNQGR